ncbi:unnamed protein product [Brassica rapa]|uniref:FLZ-type domain-containing protein n=1 Tax=Brassica campestris TaxID=3711 RepID=A0A3P6CWT0_BRACM|nr:unnamed protein product [Brassica rapa]VDD20036.1 unnamed protein product [Brassica rapa]
MSQQPNSKSLSDYETAWSPTSPLEFRLFLGNPFGGSSSLRSIPRMHQRSWDSGKVGLRIVDSLDDHRTDSSRILLPSPDSKNMIFGSLMMNPFTKAPMLKDDKPNVDGSCSGAVNNNDACQQGSVSEPIESEVEISEEDYTCVISHGPEPKTTHIYGSQVLESVEDDGMTKKGCCEDEKESIFVIAPLDLATIADELLPPSDFLRFCSFCSKKLGMGKDIYMYRGYKAFCSSECRSEVILLDEEREEEEDEEAKSDSSSDKDLSKKKSSGVIFTVG